MRATSSTAPAAASMLAGAYAELAEGGKVKLAFCWSHVRRRFYEIQVATPAPIASEALVRIAALYAVESDIRGNMSRRRSALSARPSKPGTGRYS